MAATPWIQALKGSLGGGLDGTLVVAIHVDESPLCDVREGTVAGGVSPCKSHGRTLPSSSYVPTSDDVSTIILTNASVGSVALPRRVTTE